MKQALGREIAARVRDGETLGIGTGSTVDAAITALGERIAREGVAVFAYTTSFESIRRCEAAGIKVLDSHSGARLAWGFDGADAADERCRVIKGGGGALLREKILASRCEQFVVLVDESKVTENIATRFAVPVECVPEALRMVEVELRALGAIEVTLRRGTGIHGPVVTAYGNMILDARFPSVSDTLERDIKCITGVVENGLFLTQVSELLVASASGIRCIKRG